MKLPNARSVILHEDLTSLSQVVAQRIAELSESAIEARGLFRIALAGGESPRRCYETLRELPLDWMRVYVYFGDERCLPQGDAQRNDTMAYQTLLNHVAIPAEHIHVIPAEKGALRAAVDYASLLENDLPLDLVLLGMGEDGHTASLFPDNPALQGTASAVAVFNAPKPPPERVSLSMSTLNNARHKLFLVAGAGKREALQAIANGASLPAAKVIGAEWHLDHAAWG